MVISKITGYFKNFEGSAVFQGDDFRDVRIHFTADVQSIETGHEQRNAHLRSSDFFHAREFPQLTFKGTQLEKLFGHNYKLHGQLTMRGNTKPLVLNVMYGGRIQDQEGKDRMGFELEGNLSRKSFGLLWNDKLKTGEMTVNDEVKIHCNVQLVKAEN